MGASDVGRGWPRTQDSHLWLLGNSCWLLRDDGCRWLRTQASRLWLLGNSCWLLRDDDLIWQPTQASYLAAGQWATPAVGVGELSVTTPM